MTGKYIDFKGKLKVGDRVRVNSEEACTITSVDDRGFGYRCGDTDFYKVWGTLELLSPSPRVISLETLEPGDEVERMFQGEKYLATCLDVSKNGIVKHMEETRTEGQERAAIYTGDVAWSTTARKMGFDGWQPVQPASPPAPAEKEEEWWEDRKKFWKEDRHLGGPECPTPLFEKIIAEAKRRGAEEVRNAAKAGFMECDTCRAIPGTPPLCRGCLHNRKIIESLNKPAGAGEK